MQGAGVEHVLGQDQVDPLCAVDGAGLEDDPTAAALIVVLDVGLAAGMSAPEDEVRPPGLGDGGQVGVLADPASAAVGDHRPATLREMAYRNGQKRVRPKGDVVWIRPAQSGNSSVGRQTQKDANP